jgi:hypothetical protein
MTIETFLQTNPTTGNPKEITPIDVSTGAADGGKIPALDSTGRLDESMMPVGVTPEVTTATASEDLGAGDWVNLHLSGTLRARKADCSNGRRADGFVLSAVLNGAAATVYRASNKNTARSGMTVAATYFLGTAGGQATTIPAAGAGVIVQRLGTAESATEIVFAPGQVIERG